MLVGAFPLSWSHYVRLLSVSDPDIRAFYESEAIRGGWSVRQLDRQVSTLFKVFATRYRISLPDEDILRREILETQRVIETRAAAKKALP